VHPDHLGTPRAVTRPSDNALVWKWENTEPFGNSLPDENPNGLGVFAYNLRFPGQYYDQETGATYNWMRDYDSRIGRYIQSDPIGLGGGLNTYGYVLANPLRFSDPRGRDPIGQAVGRGVGLWGGRAVGGLIGTAIEPGGGTAIGAWLGGAIGSRIGGAIGNAVGDMCFKVDEKDKEICDKNLEADEDSCHENYGNGLRGPGFSSALNACLQHARKRRDACYKGQEDPGPFNGNSWPGGGKR
jgi:RHS repeat-associated protein